MDLVNNILIEEVGNFCHLNIYDDRNTGLRRLEKRKIKEHIVIKVALQIQDYEVRIKKLRKNALGFSNNVKNVVIVDYIDYILEVNIIIVKVIYLWNIYVNVNDNRDQLMRL